MPGTESKFEGLARQVESSIARGEYAPGDRLPSERDLAARLSVNRITLRKALKLLAARGVLVHVENKGMFVPGPVGGPRGDALYVGQTSSHFYKELYLAIVREAQRHGCRLRAFPTDDAVADSLRASALAEAVTPTTHILCAGHALDLVRAAGERRAASTIVVDLFDRHVHAGFQQVLADRLRAACLATRHLIELGHERIALVCGGTGGRADPRDPILQGCELALRESGLDLHAVAALDRADPDAHVGMIAKAISGRTAPTAVVCDMDYRAVSIMEAARGRGMKLPGELSIVGIGNTPWCEALRPALTSVSLGEDQMARLAVSLLGTSADADGAALYVRPRLVRRDSDRQVAGKG